MSVVFVSPIEKRTGFFVNPHRFERLFLESSKEFDSKTFSFELFDTTSPSRLETKYYEIVVLDVTVGSWPDSIRKIMETYKATVGYVIVGDTVTDGYLGQNTNSIDIFTIFDCPIEVIPRHDTAKVVQAIAALKQASSPLSDCQSVEDQGKTSISKEVFVAAAAVASNDLGFQYFLPGLSSGCEEHCTFCRLSNRTDTKGVVTDLQNDPVSIMCSVREKFNLESFQFTDENFLGGLTTESRRQRLKAVNRLSERLSSAYESWTIGVDTRCDSIVDLNEDEVHSLHRRKVLEEFNKSGWRYAYLGVESFAPTQLKRYAKRISIDSIFAAINACRSIGVEFTLGAIWFDPLVQLSELRESVKVVKDNDLFAHIGPIFKEMRVQVMSPYGRIYAQRFSTDLRSRAANNLVYIDPKNVQYLSSEVYSILRVGRILQSIMSKAGYRHSDIAFLRVLLSPFANTDAMQRVPYLVSKREIELLEYLLASHKQINDYDASLLALNAVKDTATDIKRALEATPIIPDSKVVKIRDYLFSVMQDLYRQAEDILGNSSDHIRS